MTVQLDRIGPAKQVLATKRGFRIMDASWSKPVSHQPAAETAADLLVASCLAAAAAGDLSAYFDLGVAYSTGSHGAPVDLIEAHKWFNLAAVAGYEDAAQCRADVAEEMTAREIAEAQRRAREWLAAGNRKAA
jgi:TPR repeat protein